MINKTKPFIYKRVLAYVIDIFIVAMISSLITLIFPSNKVYEEKLAELQDIVIKYQNEEIKESEFSVLYDDINYELSKNSIESTIVIIAVTLIYFVLLNYYTDGITIGKRLMKIRITNVSDNKLTINNYLVRCLIINSVLANIISVILLEFLSKEKYLLYNSKISTLFSIIYILCFVFALYRNDGRGLHELLCNTKVVAFDEKRELDLEESNKEVKEEKKDVIQEAEYVEKEVINETKKKVKKNSRKTSKGSEK